MNSSKKPIARIDATIIPHSAMVKGFVNTALMEVENGDRDVYIAVEKQRKRDDANAQGHHGKE